MADPSEHPHVPTIKRQLAEREIDRREFLRAATLLGMSAGAAYAFVGEVTGEPWIAREPLIHAVSSRADGPGPACGRLPRPAGPSVPPPRSAAGVVAGDRP